MEVVKNISNSVKAGWNGLSQLKKIGVISVLILTVLMGSVLAYNSKKIEYKLLFSGIEEADAGEIVEDLETKKIAYQLENNGTTILIDQKYVDTYRIGLAVNDMLPSSSIGFEIFDTTSMMATDEDRQISYQRAIQGELTRAIITLDGITSAQVLLSLPEESVFTRPGDLSEASASIMLTTSNNRVIPNSTIEGIASLVSGAVENLPMKNVKIMDSTGNLLSTFLQLEDGTTTSGLSSRNQQIKLDYERELEQKVIRTLAPIYGAENLSISVDAQMNFDTSEEEKVEYGTDSKIRSEVINASGGEINSNIANGTPNDQASQVIVEGKDGTTASYNATKNYEIDSTTTKTLVAPGKVDTITAAVIYNSGTPGLKDDELATIVKNTIKADDVKVSQAKFTLNNMSVETETERDDGRQTFLEQYMLYIIASASIFVVGIVIAIIMHGIKRRRIEKEEWAEEEEMIPNKENGSTEREELEEIQTVIQNEKAQKEQDVHNYAKSNPNLVADLIKMWVKDGK